MFISKYEAICMGPQVQISVNVLWTNNRTSELRNLWEMEIP